MPSLPNGDACVRKGQAALAESGFGDGGVNNGNTAFGYDQPYVGAVWCLDAPSLAFIAVSGPSSATAGEKVDKILRAFELGSP